jgi:hypothetical protein
MKRVILAACITLAASAALPAPLARSSSGDWVRLLDTPCPAEVQAVIPEAEWDQYRAARAQIAGKQFDACWAVVSDAGAVSLYYADGDRGLISMLAFHEDRDL